MSWADYRTARISRGATEEISKRLYELIQSAESAIRRHELDHPNRPCPACALLRERVERARECFEVLV